MEREKLIQTIQETETELDERESMIKIASYRWAHLGGYLAMLVVMLLKGIYGDGFVHDIMMIFTGQLTFMTLYLYRRGRNRRLNFWLTIIGLLLFLGTTYSTVRHYGIF